MTIMISADVETSGPVPGLGDLVSFGLVVIEPGLKRVFRSGLMRAEHRQHEIDRYRVIGCTREEHENAPVTIGATMRRMELWFEDILATSRNGRCLLVTDNPGFDFMWLATESHLKLGHCQFGHSARRIGDVWAGLVGKPRDTRGWKDLIITPHDHDPVNDAMGVAEAWLAMWALHGTTKEARLAGVPKPKIITTEGLA